MSALYNTIRSQRWGVRIALILAVTVLMASSGMAQEDPHRAATLPPDFSLQGGSIQAVLPEPVGSGLLHVNGMAFKPDVYNTPYAYTGVALSNPSGSPADYHAAINLPNGAEIKKVIFVYYDFYWPEDITMSLDFQPFDYFGYGHVAQASSTAALAEIRYVEVTNFDYNPVVDSEQFTYLLHTTIPGGGTVYLISVRIEYSYTTFAPLIRR